MMWTNGTIPTNPISSVYSAQSRTTAGFDDKGRLLINFNPSGATVAALSSDATADDTVSDNYLVFTETGDNTGIFSNTDDSDDSNIDVNSLAKRGTTATFNYNDSAQSFTVANYFGTVDMDAASVGDEWNSGESLAVSLTDQDFNTNSLSKQSYTVTSGKVPTVIIGSPLTLDDDTTISAGLRNGYQQTATTVDAFSKIGNVTTTTADNGQYITVWPGYTVTEYLAGIYTNSTVNGSYGYNYISYDISSLTTTTVTGIKIFDNSTKGITQLYSGASGSLGTQAVHRLNVTAASGYTASQLVMINFTTGSSAITAGDKFYVDILSFGDGDTASERKNNSVYRMLLKESADNTGIFTGTVEYVMLNQLNVDSTTVFDAIDTLSRDINIIVHEDLTDEDSVRVSYLDLGADGVSTQISDQLAAPTHSGVVSTDMPTYKIGDTVTVTLDDQDLNVDVDLVDVYITVAATDQVGNSGSDIVLSVTFDDTNWSGLHETGFTLVETAKDSGIFVGSFQVPQYTTGSTSATGKDLELNYLDFRDASGETIEVGSGSSIRANTGSVSFDRTVYPVPFGNVTPTSTADQRFALHTSAANLNSSYENALAQGDVTVHVRVTDADYNLSASGEDKIADTTGPVVVKIERGSSTTTVATVGSVALPMKETSPTSGVFEYDITVDYNDGPTTNCPTSFGSGANCLLQGDVITVTYTDTTDSSGQSQTVTDSATFDLRNGVIQSDKSVYIIGSDMILTLIDPDLDLDNDGAQSYTLDLIEWDSDAATGSLGPKSALTDVANLDPEPSQLRETGDSTGIFQVVIEIPNTLGTNGLDRGEKIDLEYIDRGPAGANYVGHESEDINLTVYTSNFGATVELDQKVYSWTDKVFITVVAPDHNYDSLLIDAIGETTSDPLKVSTRGNQLANYKLIESGADTGIFIGEVTLKGFAFDADGDTSTGSSGNEITGTASSLTTGASSGPTGGNIAATNNDGLTVSFEFSEDETVVGSALIRWNIAEVQWLEASYPASGTGVIRIIDADMNLNPEAVDNFKVDAWSDSDAGGIDLTVSETNEATGIFEGTVFFTVADDSSGARLRVAEGDTITAEYEDNTLPEPYTTADELDITATSLIGTLVPPLERAPAANLRTVDAFGNSLNSVSVDQQVQITAELANGQDREQSFAYLVQIQDGNGVTVSLAWITGSLSAGQSFSPALSWIPTESGSYTATAFVWESVDNPTALSPPVSTTIVVQ